eukprot:12418181-Karenia_brevis.AAC.2
MKGREAIWAQRWGVLRLCWVQVGGLKFGTTVCQGRSYGFLCCTFGCQLAQTWQQLSPQAPLVG